MENETTNSVRQYCGFKVGGDHFAIPVLDVQEVIKYQSVTPIPLSQEYVKGLINLRGQIVTLISLRKLFGYEENNSTSYMNIIVRGKDGLYSLVVDEVTDIIDVSSEEIESPPETLSPQLKDYVENVYKFEKGLLVLLQTQSMLNLKLIEKTELEGPSA
jgi:purine-binding chemotaxis protein CheW